MTGSLELIWEAEMRLRDEGKMKSNLSLSLPLFGELVQSLELKTKPGERPPLREPQGVEGEANLQPLSTQPCCSLQTDLGLEIISTTAALQPFPAVTSSWKWSTLST